MPAFKLKGYCSFATEILKKFDRKGVRPVSCLAMQAKQTSDKRKIGVFNKIVQSSYSSGKSIPVLSFLEKELEVPKEQLHLQLSKMSVRKSRKLTHIKEVLNFLRQNGYQNFVIAESVQICFYSIEHIQNGFQQIAEHEEKLSKIGLHNGFAKKEKTIFTQATSLSNKKLQLCLYYMELPYDFTGHGSYV